MIFRVNYEGGLFIDVELYNTEAVRKFRWAHIANLKPNQYSRTFKPNHSILIYEGYTDRSCLLYTSPSPRDRTRSRMPSSA